MHRKILIIDDDQSLVAPLKEGLEAMGYRVASAFDGLQGLEAAKQERPDLVILDFYMPGGGGAKVYERLRAAKDTGQTPIVFSTVVSMEEVKGKIQPSAHTYFLRKPVGLGQLAALIRSVLGEPAPAPAPAPVEEPPLLDRGTPTASAPRVYDIQVRITYADTDRMGVVYYANYLRFFEQGRTEMLRGLGARYRDLEANRKLYLPVTDASCHYETPARYDDLVIVRTWLTAMGKASVVFAYEVLDAADPARRLASGHTKHAALDERWKPARLPEDIRAALTPFLGPEPA